MTEIPYLDNRITTPHLGFLFRRAVDRPSLRTRDVEERYFPVRDVERRLTVVVAPRKDSIGDVEPLISEYGPELLLIG